MKRKFFLANQFRVFRQLPGPDVNIDAMLDADFKGAGAGAPTPTPPPSNDPPAPTPPPTPPAINNENIDAVLDAEFGLKNDPPPPPDPGTSPANVTELAPLTNFLKENIEGYEMPADLTKEGALQHVIESLSEPITNKVKSQFDEEALRYNDFLKAGGKPNDYFQSDGGRNVDEMSADEVLLSRYKEKYKDKFTDEQYKEQINKLDAFDKEEKADEARELFKSRQSADTIAKQKQQADMMAQNKVKAIAQITTMAEQTIKAIGNKTEFAGMAISAEDIADFNPVFKALVTPDDTGVAPSTKILNDDQVLYKLLYLASKANVVKNFLSDAKKQEITDIKSKLFSSPSSFNTKQVSNSGALDYDALSRPAK